MKDKKIESVELGRASPRDKQAGDQPSIFDLVLVASWV
jgi:hypothetical protein